MAIATLCMAWHTVHPASAAAAEVAHASRSPTSAARRPAQVRLAHGAQQCVAAVHLHHDYLMYNVRVGCPWLKASNIEKCAKRQKLTLHFGHTIASPFCTRFCSCTLDVKSRNSEPSAVDCQCLYCAHVTSLCCA